jgi:hypothetical protein
MSRLKGPRTNIDSFVAVRKSFQLEWKLFRVFIKVDIASINLGSGLASNWIAINILANSQNRTICP